MGVAVGLLVELVAVGCSQLQRIAAVVRIVAIALVVLHGGHRVQNHRPS